MKLTQAGQILYQAAKEIIQKHHTIEESLQTLSRVMSGSVRAATVNSVGLYEIAAPLKKYLRAFPGVHIRLEYARVNKIYEDVGRGEVDLGLVAYPIKRQQILSAAFRENRLV